MPYTPPAQQSHAALGLQSPPISRTHSYTNTAAFLKSPASSPKRPGIPRAPSSASYLSLHRRSPSLSTSSKSNASHPQSPKGSQDGPNGVGTYSESLRQSPPPMTDSPIPPGAVISPPDSVQTSSDDEGSPREPRGRQLDNLAELQAAIMEIGQQRQASPEGQRLDVDGTTEPQTSHADHASRQRFKSTPPLSRQARKISHSRSSTEGSIVCDTNPKSPSTEDSENDSDQRSRPVMVRKKSGELVKPALRPSSCRRFSSMPGTPTYSKAVHFDSHLEHVRHFLRLDKPQAVSAGSSPQEAYDSDPEYPFGGDDCYRPRSPPFEWDIVLSNFPSDTPQRSAQPVRVERVFLSKDSKMLIGTVAVANLAFHKLVVARFTLDYWRTTSEVVAEYTHNVRKAKVDDGCDRFNFNIKLTDQANLESKTLFFCVRYSVNGQDYWDNNNSMNFQVEFRKRTTERKDKSATGGLGARPLRAIPRGRQSTSSTGRPWSMPSYFDDFAEGFDSYDYSSFKQSAAKLVGEANGSSDAKANLSDDESREVPTRKAGSGGAAFGNRYDFGASLSAAINAAKTKSEAKADKPNGLFAMHTGHGFSSPPLSPMTMPASDNTTQPSGPGPDAYRTEKPSTQSPSYLELIDKYCFVRSGAPWIAERS